ncbi:melatonin receptor type 1B-A-like [Acanthaster planci]|uniref:Melatonin receptor type 1B-A-like n=1 Tax=Acanthaster planci TaxID=133434 RepID=A0A8B7ZM02_ACAPL|nr:melatonin receptor type 1B-A-like [Acanthaster planci]
MKNVTNMTSTVNATSINPAELTFSNSERVGIGVVFLITSILAIIGNVMVIVAVIRSKSLQTTTNAFVVCLSVANLMTGLSLPWSVVGLLSLEGWPLASEVPCQLAGLVLLTSIGASLYSLAGIALNRVLIIVASPSTYQWWHMPTKIAGMISVAWLLPFLIVLVPPLCNVGKLGYDKNTHICTDVSQHPRQQDHRLAIAMVFYLVPMTTVITSYSLIFQTIRRNFRHQTEQCTATPMQPSDFDWGVGHESRKARLKQHQHSTTVNLFVNVCVFLLLNLPYGIALIIPDNKRIAVFSGMVFLMHSFVHPLLYGFKHPQFHHAFREMLHLTEDLQPSTGSGYTRNELRQNARSDKIIKGLENSKF